MREPKLRSVVNWTSAFNQNGVKEMGLKLGLGVYSIR
jgi:hypothetical protein